MHGGSMKDKIISFILILLTVAILGAIVLFGYVAYVEITGNDITSIKKHPLLTHVWIYSME